MLHFKENESRVISQSPFYFWLWKDSDNGLLLVNTFKKNSWRTAEERLRKAAGNNSLSCSSVDQCFHLIIVEKKISFRYKLEMCICVSIPTQCYTDNELCIRIFVCKNGSLCINHSHPQTGWMSLCLVKECLWALYQPFHTTVPLSLC